MKSDPPLVPPQPLTWELSGRLGEIVAERIAGLPLEQRTEVAQRTIIEVLLHQREVPLVGLLRRYVAQELERLWLPEELKQIHRERERQILESTLFLAKWEEENQGLGESGEAETAIVRSRCRQESRRG